MQGTNQGNPPQITPEEAKLSLHCHAADKGTEICEKYGPHLGWNALLRLLQDRDVIRYPCEIVFDQSSLLEGEFAHPVQKGKTPAEGFTMYIHPYFCTQLERAVYLVLYQLVLINYGPFATPDDAEIFGANALGLAREDYYTALCAMADEISN